ncbi:AC5 protein [Conyza yellow vein virus]|nr:AC5 protein [Conyza yellow vein virus]UED37346.1 AC5 protein [Conyza yellow vein virus]
MGTCHIKQKRIFRLILILACFLMIINYMIKNPKKLLNYCLLLAGISTTRQSLVPCAQNLETIPKIILNGCSTWLIIIHVKNLTKVHGSSIRTSIPN